MQDTGTKLTAKELDSQDPLKDYRNKFYIPKHKDGSEVIYLCGNSLGLQPKNTEEYILQELRDWKDMAVEGHFHAKRPWKYYHEFLTEQTAQVVGAQTNEVVNMNSLTVNLNLMMVSFYRPEGKRKKILMEANAFPSDIYAVESHIKWHGFDPKDTVITIKPKEGENNIRTADLLELIEKEGDEIALIIIGGVNYYTGQAFDMKAITEAGHKKGCKVGFDLAHAAGNLHMHLHDWNVDFAVWCSYKYLNSGPGAVAGCFVHEKHAKDFDMPRFSGWWGHKKQTRFMMPEAFDPSEGVEGWQISNPPIFQMAALKASLDVFSEAGMENLRRKSEHLTGYLADLINSKLKGSSLENNLSIITPADKDQRGCQLSLRFAQNGKEVHTRLMDNGIICDWREPDVVRIAPVPLYNSFEDAEKFVWVLFGNIDI